MLIHGIGVYCDCCGVCADPECVKKANMQLKCKIITSGNENQPHHWVKGTLHCFFVIKNDGQKFTIFKYLIYYLYLWLRINTSPLCCSEPT